MATEVAEAAGHAAEHALTPSAYIAEHLQNFNSIGGKQASVVDFSVINWDTISLDTTPYLAMPDPFETYEDQVRSLMESDSPLT